MTKVTQEMVDEFVNELLSDRLENYGYSYQRFRNLSQQRYRARKALRRTYVTWATVQAAPLGYRVSVCEVTGKLDYTVGQSGNEERTNLMRQLVNPNAKWLF